MYLEYPAMVTPLSVRMGSVIEWKSPITVSRDVDWLASKLKIGKEMAKTWMRISARKKDGMA
jgi:hypothetical protein